LTSAKEPVGRLSTMVIDVSDLERGAIFWGGVLGQEPGKPSGQYLQVGSISPGVNLYLQQVPESKSVKNRVHFDLGVTNLDEAVSRVLALGGKKVRNEGDDSYRMGIVADPDGNEFCLLPPMK